MLLLDGYYYQKMFAKCVTLVTMADKYHLWTSSPSSMHLFRALDNSFKTEVQLLIEGMARDPTSFKGLLLMEMFAAFRDFVSSLSSIYKDWYNSYGPDADED